MQHASSLFTLSDNGIQLEPINYNTPPTLSYGTCLTPFGLCCIVHDNSIILHLSFCEQSAEHTHFHEIQTLFPNNILEHDETRTQLLCEQIFFHRHHNVPVRSILRGSAFQITVWKQLLQIPYGTTCSYQAIAQQLHVPLATRAVAHAIARNNIAYIIPCHRVIGTDNKLRGYRWGIERKKLMLQHENAIL